MTSNIKPVRFVMHVILSEAKTSASFRIICGNYHFLTHLRIPVILSEAKNLSSTYNIAQPLLYRSVTSTTLLRRHP